MGIFFPCPLLVVLIAFVDFGPIFAHFRRSPAAFVLAILSNTLKDRIARGVTIAPVTQHVVPVCVYMSRTPRRGLVNIGAAIM